jgi:hypothetical protein
MQRRAGILALMFVAALAVAARADEPKKDTNPKGGGFPDLVTALKETPGCLGVETATTGSGKQVIFAWFEDKKAALRWYHSETHVEVMKKFFGGAKRPTKPLADVPDDSGPIMAIASVTLSGDPTKDKLPFKQIAIELYQPLTGGLSIGGKFSPDKMKVPEKKKAEEKK